MEDNRVFLKVKLRSLADEARSIRTEENRRRRPSAKAFMARHGDLWSEPFLEALAKWKAGNCKTQRALLHEHRTRVVRAEARWTHLAYAFLRGRDYAQAEASPATRRSAIMWDKVREMVRKYGVGYDPRDSEAARVEARATRLSLFDLWVKEALKPRP